MAWVFYRAAWRLKYKLLKAMAERESARVLIGKVVADDAVGGGKRERGTEGKADLPSLVERLLHASVRRPPRPEKWLRLGFRYFNPIQRFFDPYKRIRAIADKVEVEIDLPGLAIVPLKTVARWQPRLNWSKGWVTNTAPGRCLSAIDALPEGSRALVTAHHPLREAGTQGTALTRNGQKAMTELAKRNVLAVLSGHVHDAFDLTQETVQGPVRMIGAGTLSRRLRSTPPSFNELRWDGEHLAVCVRNLEDHDTQDMMIGDVPEDATPPRKPDEPVAPVDQIPRIDPPVH